MNDADGFGLNDMGRGEHHADQPHPRAAVSPLPVEASDHPPPTHGPGDPQPFMPIPPRRALANSPAASGAEHPSGLQRAVNTLRLALPFVQRVLPLLDGNIATVVSNILSPHPPAPPPAPPVDLEPLEDCLAGLQTQHRDLRNRIVEQNSTLKRVEDQLERVREATDRNALGQRELMEDLKTVGNRVNRFALVLLGLLAISIVLNMILYLRIQRLLR